MSAYKPGDVSAVLFKQTKSAMDQSLVKLFASKVSPVIENQEQKLDKKSFHTEAFSLDQSNSQHQKRKSKPVSLNKENNLNNDGQAKPKPKKKVKLLKTIVGKEKGNVADKTENFSESKSHKGKTKSQSVDVTPSEFPFVHETLLLGSTKSETHGKKRKYPSQEDEETPFKRQRTYRHRDKSKDTRTIFIGNCSLSADKKSLRTLFRKFGAIESMRFRCAPAAHLDLPRRAVVIKKDFHEQSSSFAAFIVYKEEESAKKAISMNGHLLHDLHLRVDLASQSKKHDKKRSIFVGNLPFDIKEEQLREHFDDCGEIVNVRVIRDRRTSLGKGFAYVQFESKDSVNLALKLDVSQFRGRPLRVRVCTNNPDKIEERKAKRESKESKKEASPQKKKVSFAPSNMASSTFHSILKSKKEKRLRKIKKKKENMKKSDGLSTIFGEAERQKKSLKKKNRQNSKASKQIKKKGLRDTKRTKPVKSFKKRN